MKPITCLLALLLSGCATAPAEPSVRSAELTPQKIKIQTYPAGGLIDLNGNVLGSSPVEIEVMPRNRALWWPDEVNPFQTFRARWPNGATAGEVFFTDGPMPKQVGLTPHPSWFPLMGNSLQ